MPRFFALAGCIIAITAACRGEIPPPLQVALEKASEGRDRWAYTETRTHYNPDGSVKDETILRVDPSKPYHEQTVPVKIRGRPPTGKDFKKYRERGEKKADARERAEKRGQPIPGSESRTQGFDLERATLVTEDAITATYHVPLKKTDRLPFPPEKFESFIRINKKTEVIENASIKLKSAVRAKLIAKIKSGHVSIDFTQEHPDFPPVMSSLEIHASLSILFKGITQNAVVKRTEFRRVKPYDERFEVKLGPVDILDF